MIDSSKCFAVKWKERLDGLIHTVSLLKYLTSARLERSTSRVCLSRSVDVMVVVCWLRLCEDLALMRSLVLSAVHSQCAVNLRYGASLLLHIINLDFSRVLP